ncbi:urokinase plasminogen activator surface receptor-like [Sinocyclocheilus rhinocerous]|uniref:urokinase plasminogen activator surface receptor-like n=1 Tax=Sinocyclocheilus rhinocerous TaxID=307959 RepID=UPI0007B7DC7A|nr:PREDICTED: urokinase plasminogen activator surface receptor-like [Sinocyclocheilus rhinocerous]
MDLQISVFLLFLLLTAGFSCYECSGFVGCAIPYIETCPSGFSKCLSVTTATLIAGVSFKKRFKDCVADCANGSMSQSTTKHSSVCCNTDQCNAQDAPDPSIVPNGKTCYTCDEDSCSHILSCSGSEDHCFEATVKVTAELSGVIKGCLSKSFCNSSDLFPSMSEVFCCKGNLCNSAESVTQSFLFLCSSLLCLILLY